MERSGTQTMEATGFDLEVYGLRASISGDWPQAIDAVRRDFAWFEAIPGKAEVSITIERGLPQLDRYGEIAASFVTPSKVVYQAGGLTIVDHLGQAVSILDRARGTLLVQGEDEHLAHEATRQYLLSRIGEHLDALGLARLHALALSGPAGAVALMLPSGGGRSDLAGRALQADGVALLSEESPLLDRFGRLHPFPLGIGTNGFDPERIESEPRPLRHLVIGRRSLGADARLEPVTRSAAVGPLLRESVVGVGLYQGMELVLQRGMREVLRKAGVAATRARCCAAAVRRARVWELTLGRDDERNWSALRPLLSA